MFVLPVVLCFRCIYNCTIVVRFPYVYGTKYMVFFVLSAQFFLDNSHFFFHTHVVCRNFYRLRQAGQGWTRWYFIPLVIQNHEFFVTSSCLFLLFMSVQSSTVSVACRSAGDTSERFRGCLSGYSKETYRHWGKCLSSTA